MKRLTFLLLIIFFGINHFGYSQKKQPNLIQIFNPSNKCDTSVSKTEYIFQSGFCTTILNLYTDSTFSKPFGCENEGNVSIGKWTKENDSIVLIESRRDSVNLICNINYSKSLKNKVKTFIFKDRSNKPITGIYLIPTTMTSDFAWEKNGNNTYAKIDPFKYRNFVSDDNGIIQINSNKHDSLEFLENYQFTGRKLKFATKNLPDTIHIRLSVDNNVFWYSLTYYSISKIFKLKVEGDKLISKYYTMQRKEDK